MRALVACAVNTDLHIIMPQAVCDANATGAVRHTQLVAAISSHSVPTNSRDVLVLNTIDRHYTTLIGAWARMVQAAPFAKQLFVVAMDADAAAATHAANVPYFSPLAERDACTQREHASLSRVAGEARLRAGGEISLKSSHDAAPPGSYKKIKI